MIVPFDLWIAYAEPLVSVFTYAPDRDDIEAVFGEDIQNVEIYECESHFDTNENEPDYTMHFGRLELVPDPEEEEK